ncbi:MAG: phosphate ABC transporter permease subunit PstC [Chitinivibrionales bacterium]|nr:phosphate ABC transporter permease subunit PstC [Chitinivibrionales bacterium]MBD3394118.1 phosphate ABC transporter permease subunit PstC [Chitinivibrionales bacterium]
MQAHNPPNSQPAVPEARAGDPTPSVRPVRGRFARGEATFRWALLVGAIAMLLLLAGIFVTLLIGSRLSLSKFGFRFLAGTEWDPISQEFGALPFLVGTLLTSFMAIAISIPFSMAIALSLGEYFRRGWLSSVLRSMIELLAGIPSVIYGFWALFFLVPLVRSLEMQLDIPPYGVGIFTASLILAIMVVPYSASVAREVIAMVPSSLKEAAYSLGATRFEVIRQVVIPYARSGIIAGILLSLGRALGETMAVTMVIGNRNALPDGIFSPGNTMASIIANEFTEATDEIYLSALLEIGLVLFVVSTIINVTGKIVIQRLDRPGSGSPK